MSDSTTDNFGLTKPEINASADTWGNKCNDDFDAIDLLLAGICRFARAATTGNINLSNPGTSSFDGVSLSSGDFLFVWRQTTATENGVYKFNGSSSALTRAITNNTSGAMPSGMLVCVSEGTKYAATIFQLKTAAPITLDSTNLTFSKRAGARNIYTEAGSRTPTGTTSASTKMMGLGSSWVLTPNFSGRIRITIVGWAAASDANVLIVFNAKYGTGAAPANGDASAGTFFSPADTVATSTAVGSPAIPFTAIYEATGLTIGTAYWFDMALTSDGSATAVVRTQSVMIEEVPND